MVSKVLQDVIHLQEGLFFITDPLCRMEQNKVFLLSGRLTYDVTL